MIQRRQQMARRDPWAFLSADDAAAREDGGTPRMANHDEEEFRAPHAVSAPISRADVDQLARDCGLYWAVVRRREIGPSEEPWSGTMDQAYRIVEDVIESNVADQSERERLARLVLERAEWA